MKDTDGRRLKRHKKISDLADKYLAAAMAQGEPFTEGLSNWAINKAARESGAAE